MLCANAGVDGGVVVKEVLSSKGNIGYNVATDKFEEKNLATPEARRVEALRQKLDAWWPGKI